MRRVLILFVVLVSVVLATPAMAQTGRTPRGLTFAARSLAMTPDKLQTGVRVAVLNNTAHMIRGRLRLGELSLQSASKPSVLPSAAIHYPMAPFLVTAAGERTFELTATRLEVVNGTYSGHLAVFDKSTGAVDRIPVTLQVGDAAVAAVPAVASLSAQVYTRDMRASDPTIALPLDVSKGTPQLKAGSCLGVLTSDKGGIARVMVATDTLSALATGYAQTGLTIVGIDRAGTYKGTIDLAPGTSGSSFTLQVDATDWWLWPALWLVAGIVVALLLRHLKDVVRPGLGLILDDDLARQKVSKAQNEFKKQAQGKRWATYGATDAADSEAKALRNAITQLGSTSFDQLDDDQRKRLVERIKGLADVGPKLKSLAEVLPDLSKQLDAVKAFAKDGVVPGEQELPQFVVTADRLLDGDEFASLGELNAVLEKATKAKALAERWLGWHAEAKRALARIDAADSIATEDSDKALVAEARRKLFGAWVMLTEAQDADVIADRKLVEELQAALVLAAETSGIRAQHDARMTDGEAAGAGAPAPPAFDAAAVPLLPIFSSIVGSMPRATRPRIAWLRRKIGYMDWLQIAFAAGVALYSGLVALYFGKSFGTFPQYLAAFLWGYLTAGALDALVQAIRTRIATPRLV